MVKFYNLSTLRNIFRLDLEVVVHNISLLHNDDLMLTIHSLCNSFLYVKSFVKTGGLGQDNVPL